MHLCRSSPALSPVSVTTSTQPSQGWKTSGLIYLALILDFLSPDPVLLETVEHSAKQSVWSARLFSYISPIGPPSLQPWCRERCHTALSVLSSVKSWSKFCDSFDKIASTISYNSEDFVRKMPFVYNSCQSCSTYFSSMAIRHLLHPQLPTAMTIPWWNELSLLNNFHWHQKSAVRLRPGTASRRVCIFVFSSLYIWWIVSTMVA